MMEPNFVPYIPATAPFSPEQRAYLNGFLAGLFSRSPGPAAPAFAAPPAGQPLQPLTIVYGSQTGNAEGLAQRAAKEAAKHRFAPTIFDMAQYPRENLRAEKHLLVITSTYGDGDPPDNAKAFWEFLSGPSVSRLPGMAFSVLALGDSNYPKFCECGKSFDRRLEELGARRACPRMDCDVELEEPFHAWLANTLQAMVAIAGDASGLFEDSGSAHTESSDRAFPLPMNLQVEPLAPSLTPGEGEKRLVAAEVTARAQISASTRALSLLPACGREGQGEGKRGFSGAYSRSNPFPAPLLTNGRLNGSGSAKDTRHFEISLEGSGLSYEAGDALGVVPTNCPELVEEILEALAYSGDETAPDGNGRQIALRQALLHQYEIRKVPQIFLEAVAEKAGDDTLKRLSGPGVNGELEKFLWGREVIDLLLMFPAAKFGPVEFVSLLKKLQPRLYSISSNPKAHPSQVHLTVAAVRYESHGRRRKGVCSTFLADRIAPAAPVAIFVHNNKHFRPPSDRTRPMIMVGPGTGIAPFRAFLHERRAIGAPGRTWLFFGDQHVKTDFLYRDELESMLRDGTLTRLDTAFSRDQGQKIYVQHRMLENARELYAWLEDGAHIYICGDASRMAKDVHQALLQVIQRGGGLSLDDAAEHVKKLQADKRYQRDVY